MQENVKKLTRQVSAGNVKIGGGAPITIQSMTNTRTEDVEATSVQLAALEAAGCEIARISVYNEAAAAAIPALKKSTAMPLVADIHFDYRLALLAIQNGIDKLRINPGNIGRVENVQRVCAAARERGVPVRIGVNSGSVEKELLHKYGGPTPKALAESALNHAAILEKEHFYDTVISVKASDVAKTVLACQTVSESCDYPLHIGVTEAGFGDMGLVKGAMGIGALLLSGIGDTVRVSLTGDPVQEVFAAKLILDAAGVRKEGLEVISCPTCGRTTGDIQAVAERVKRELGNPGKPLKVAVMGCVVNGPGEAKEADIGVAFGPTGGAVFKKGELLFTAPLSCVVERLIEEAKKLL